MVDYLPRLCPIISLARSSSLPSGCRRRGSKRVTNFSEIDALLAQGSAVEALIPLA